MSSSPRTSDGVVPDSPRNIVSPARRALAIAVFVALIALVVREDRVSREPVETDSADQSFALSEVSKEIGLDFVHRASGVHESIAHIEDLIMAVGAAVSITDVNDDGWVDVYTTTSDFGAPNALFVNRGDGTFVDRAAELGCADLNLPGRGVSMGSVFGDFDNDGDEALFLYRFGYPALLRNDGEEGFTEIT
ncbi:MAG: FG-GAP repeat domain-containing protein, partial [Planctomycetota bacterium]